MTTTNEDRARVLIVDDEKFIRDILADFLGMEGYVVRTAEDGQAALNELHHAHYDLVISDLKMPRMGGIELLDWLDKHEEFRLIPSIVLTSSNDQADIARAFRHGAKGYMIKPVQFGELQKLMGIIADYWRASCVPLPIRATG